MVSRDSVYRDGSIPSRSNQLHSKGRLSMLESDCNQLDTMAWLKMRLSPTFGPYNNQTPNPQNTSTKENEDGKETRQT